MKRTFGFIAVIGSIAYFGNILNIGLTYAVAWQRMDTMAFMQGFETTFLLLLPTVGFTLLPGFIGIIASIYLNKGNKKASSYWKIALYASLISIALTLAYHLPTNLAFIQQSYTIEEASHRLNLWVLLHWVRIVLALIASVYVIIGFQKSFNGVE
ncbi:MAG: DUF1772 domain-containing protein [Saprospiraceae bacterium]|nr:DUF1772 domain-containing protein [Saprospiraceae bacterium]